MEFDVLYQELARGAVMIQTLVAGIPPEEARVKPSPEAWSMLEVVCHLLDEERYDFRKYLGKILEGSDQPRLQAFSPGQETARPHNERDLAKSLDEFLEERSRSLAWLKALTSPDWNLTITLTFGPSEEKLRVTAGDMLVAWAAHDNLHMRQLVELRRERLVHLAEPYDAQYAGRW